MSRIFVHGYGAVSPAGWGIEPLREAVAKGKPLPVNSLERPGWNRTMTIRRVPPAPVGTPFLRQARLRRSSPIAQFTAAAALEALGADAALVSTGELRLGIILCVMSGCVNYSRRFYSEALHDPSTASPLVFPETVFNAPASHLAAILGTSAINYTIVGDPGTFLQGVAMAADWLDAGSIDGCLVVGSEENDWMTADAFRLFSKQTVLSEGAGALYLRKDKAVGACAELQCVTDSHLFCRGQGRVRAARKARSQLPTTPEDILVDGVTGVPRVDAAEVGAWQDWRGARLSPKTVAGESLMAATAWQCALAVDALRQNNFPGASVSVVGCNQQAIGAHFVKTAGDKASPKRA